MSGPIIIPKHKNRNRVAKVQVIDDEPEITEIVDEFLKSAGFAVVTENSSIMGVERAKTYMPDVILLDIMMPGMDGYQICEELKRNPDTKDIPVVFLTGKDSREDHNKSFSVGGDLFIKKPFSGDRLIEIINVVLVSLGKY